MISLLKIINSKQEDLEDCQYYEDHISSKNIHKLID